MKGLIKYIAVVCLTIILPLSVWGNDSTVIVFDCVPQINALDLQAGDYILINNPGHPPDTLRDVGAENPVPFSKIILNSYNLFDSDFVRFEVFSTRYDCKSRMVSFALDSLNSAPGYFLITEFSSDFHHFNYKEDTVCSSTTVVYADTDIPDNAFSLTAGSFLRIDSANGSVLPAESKPGSYKISIRSDFCLGFDSIDFIQISSVEPVELDDTLNLCANTLNENTSLADYIFYSSPDSPGKDYNEITESGYYMAQKKCPCSDLMFVRINLIPDEEPPALPNIFYHCIGQDFSEQIPQRMDYYPSEEPDTYFDKQNPNTGSYVFTYDGVCPSKDTVWIEALEAPELNLQQERFCDKVVVRVESSQSWGASYIWSDSSTGASVEVTENMDLSVRNVSKEGCVTTRNEKIIFSPLRLASVDYTLTHSTCWKEGRLGIRNIEVYNNLGSYDFRLVNTLTGKIADDFENLQEGVYRFDIKDSGECKASYDELITIEQDCLNDYPVFTPNNDGEEDEYFIPHEGVIKILNNNGILLRTLSTPGYWDGCDAAGNLLPMGNYLLVTEKEKIVNITIVR